MGQSDQHLEIPTWATGSPGRSDRRMGLHEHPQFANHLLDEPKTFIEGWAKLAQRALAHHSSFSVRDAPMNWWASGRRAGLGPPYGSSTVHRSRCKARAKLFESGA